MILGSRQYYIGALGIILSIVMAVVIVYFWEDVLALKAYGYAGAFIISMLGGATILAPVPMTPMVFALGGVLNPVFVGAAAGLGEALGALVIYMTGYSGRIALTNSSHGKIQAVYLRVLKWVERKGSLTLFLLSAVLSPFFYPAGLAAEAARFSIGRYFLICWGGKTIKGMTVAFAGYWGLRGLLRMLGMPV
jgi:hypothetical protein